MRRTAIVIHAFGGPAGPPRRLSTKPVHTSAPDRVPAGRHHIEDGSWLGLAERVLRPWPVALRLAVLLLVLATGTATVAVAVAVVAQLLIAVLSLRIDRRHRRHMLDLRIRLATIRRRVRPPAARADVGGGPGKRRTAGRHTVGLRFCGTPSGTRTSTPLGAPGHRSLPA